MRLPDGRRLFTALVEFGPNGHREGASHFITRMIAEKAQKEQFASNNQTNGQYNFPNEIMDKYNLSTQDLIAISIIGTVSFQFYI